MSFEKERALLMTRVTVAEAQVLELQDYIEKHLSRSGSSLMCRLYVGSQTHATLVLTTDCRYEQEIAHLRGLHGTVEEAGRSQSAKSAQC